MKIGNNFIKAKKFKKIMKKVKTNKDIGRRKDFISFPPLI